MNDGGTRIAGFRRPGNSLPFAPQAQSGDERLSFAMNNPYSLQPVPSARPPLAVEPSQHFRDGVMVEVFFGVYAHGIRFQRPEKADKLTDGFSESLEPTNLLTLLNARGCRMKIIVNSLACEAVALATSL